MPMQYSGNDRRLHVRRCYVFGEPFAGHGLGYVDHGGEGGRGSVTLWKILIRFIFFSYRKSFPRSIFVVAAGLVR